MNPILCLPPGYTEIFQIDLQRNKKMAIRVNTLALLIAFGMAFCAAVLVPISTLFDFSQGITVYLIKWGVLLVAIILYIILHELVHGICMKYFSGTRVHYGFTGLYAYAASEAFFYKKPYILIALAPIVVWGMVLVIINCVVPQSWFWVIYLVQICNISGAAGDLYVICKLSRMPSDVLVQDKGVSMIVYSRIGS